jgi:hypothetical protein
MMEGHSPSLDEATAVFDFDEEFYLTRYPGVAEAVKQGNFASGLQHYSMYGKREGRVPSKAIVDARRDLMLGFCALGNNCEFGMAQRTWGAEPIDLLRWANTPPLVLIRLLRAGFEGIGDPNEIEAYPTQSGEFHIRHKGYRFAWHAFANVRDTTAERVRDREVKRLPFLARKLLEDMADGTRIFVVMKSDMTSDIAREILAAMHLHGRPTLMYATPGGSLGVAREAEYLLHASIPEFADPANVTTTVRADDWMAVCKQARAI